MNAHFELKTISSDWELIKTVKNQVDAMYEKQRIFSLSLETLELTRRFNNLHMKLNGMVEFTETEYNKLVALTRHLEKNLVREIE